MHSTRTLVTTVSNNRVSCRLHHEQKLRTLLPLIVTRALYCLTAAGHCYVMLGTIKFVDKSINDNSAGKLYHCDVITLHSEVQCAHWCGTQRRSTPNWVEVIYSSSFGINYNMTVWILAGNYISFTIAAGLIRLHMPGVKKTPAMFIGNSSNHWCHKQHYNLQLCLQILCKYILLR